MLLAAWNTANKPSVSLSLSTGVTQMGGSADMRHLASPAWSAGAVQMKRRRWYTRFPQARAERRSLFFCFTFASHMECCVLMSS